LTLSGLISPSNMTFPPRQGSILTLRVTAAGLRHPGSPRSLPCPISLDHCATWSLMRCLKPFQAELDFRVECHSFPRNQPAPNGPSPFHSTLGRAVFLILNSSNMTSVVSHGTDEMPFPRAAFFPHFSEHRSSLTFSPTGQARSLSLLGKTRGKASTFFPLLS